MFALGTQLSLAVPAYPGIIKFTQSDGTTLSIYQRGDEFSHQVYTADGYPLMYNFSTRNYEYASVSNGKFVASGIVATDATKRDAKAMRFLSSVNREEAAKAGAEMQRAMRPKPKSAPAYVTADDITQMVISDVPTKGKLKGLVVLVEFSDKSFQFADPKKHYEDILNKEGFTDQFGTPGSARDYYIKNSNGAYQPDFVVAGPVKMDHTVSYYGGNGTGDNSRGDNQAIGQMIKEACLAVADEIDFKEFDTNNDGKVDNVYVFYAGYGEADSGQPETIWPHSWELAATNNTVQIDGVTVNHYAISQEINGINDQYCGIGTFVHEFGHVLGLADHYNTNNGYSTAVPGYYDTMCTGSYGNKGYTPPFYSAFERASLGWLVPTEIVMKKDSTYKLENLGDSNFAYCVSVPDNNNEFFLLENRQLKDFDAYLPGHGMLVWHIDYDQNAWWLNTPNNDEDHQRVDIVEANNILPVNAGATFPGTSNKTQYQFQSWDNVDLFAFSDVKETDEVIYFKLGNSGNVDLTAPENLTVTNISGKSATASWSAVDGADSYRVTLSDGTDERNFDKVTATTLELTDLMPLTTYTVSVQSRYKNSVSEASTTQFTTLDVQFSDRVVKALDPIDIDEDRFTARWKSVREAEAYEVQLYKQISAGKSETVCGFDDEVMPEGWTTSSSYFSRSMYGESSPSLCLMGLGHYLQMDLADGDEAKGLKFWQYAAFGDQYSIETSEDGENWTEVATGNKDLNESGASFEFPLTKHLRIYIGAKSNNMMLYIDDVTLVHQGTEFQPIGDPVRVVGDTVYTFTGLDAETIYAYGVRALNGTQKTDESNIVTVKTVKTMNIDKAAVEEDSTPGEVYDLQGRRVDFETAPAGIYIVRKDNKSHKLIKRK
ncbi:MAG: M6 family metalloprotease domain-containing protein [Prevotella sp.]|jgi:M6 family metalloprotease-like protein